MLSIIIIISFWNFIYLGPNLMQNSDLRAHMNEL